MRDKYELVTPSINGDVHRARMPWIEGGIQVPYAWDKTRTYTMLDRDNPAFEKVEGMFQDAKEPATPKTVVVPKPDPKGIHIDWFPYAADVAEHARMLKVKAEFDYTINAVTHVANPRGDLTVNPIYATRHPEHRHKAHKPLVRLGGEFDETQKRWSNRGDSFKRQEMTWENSGRDEFFNGEKEDYQTPYEPAVPKHMEGGLHWYTLEEGEYEPTISRYDPLTGQWTVREGRWHADITQQTGRPVELDHRGKPFPEPNPVRRLWSKDKNAPNLESVKGLKVLAKAIVESDCEFVGKLHKGEPAGKWPVKPWEYQPQYRALVGDNMNRFNIMEYTPVVKLKIGQPDDMYVDGVSLR